MTGRAKRKLKSSQVNITMCCLSGRRGVRSDRRDNLARSGAARCYTGVNGNFCHTRRAELFGTLSGAAVRRQHGSSAAAGVTVKEATVLTGDFEPNAFVVVVVTDSC